MADPTVFHNGFIAITTATGSAVYTEISGNKSVAFTAARAELPDGVMGDDIDAKYPGIRSVPVAATFRNDFATAAAGVDKKLYTLMNNKTAVRLKLRAVDAAVSGPNPSYIWTRVFVTKVTPINASHGELLVNDAMFSPGSGCVFSRSTAT